MTGNFKQWLISEVKSPPHLPLPYYKKKLIIIQELESKLKGFPEWIEKTSEFFYQFTGDLDYRYLEVPYSIARKIPSDDKSTRYAYRGSFSEGIKWLLEYLSFENPHGWQKFLAGVLPFGEKETTRDVLRYYKDQFAEIRTFLQKSSELKETLQEGADFLQGGENYDPSDKWPTLEEALKWVQRAVQGFKDINKLFGELQNLETKTKAYQDYIRWAYEAESGGSKLPTTKEIETLYHATVSVSKVLQSGLKSRSELDNRGKLGGGPSNVVSLTSDPEIAIAIANALITATQIAHGKLTSKDILERAEKKGIDLKDTQAYKDIEMSAKRMKTGWEPEKRWAYLHTDASFAFGLLRYYMGRAQGMGILYDPFFASVDVRDFKDIQEKDIGVLACRTRMKNASFEVGMQEFRVPSKDVIRCKKLNVKLQSVL